MRNLLMSIIFIGIAGYIGSILYQRMFIDGVFTAPVEEKSTNALFAYPDSIEIERVDGRKIVVTLLGRNASHLQFNREDGQEFVYAIESLSGKSQELVRKYPSLGIKNAAKYMAQGMLGLEDLHIQQLEQVIRNIDEKLKRYSAEFEVSVSQVERRTIERKMEGLMQERIEMQRQISERQGRGYH